MKNTSMMLRNHRSQNLMNLKNSMMLGIDQSHNLMNSQNQTQMICLINRCFIAKRINHKTRLNFGSSIRSLKEKTYLMFRVNRCQNLKDKTYKMFQIGRHSKIKNIKGRPYQMIRICRHSINQNIKANTYLMVRMIDICWQLDIGKLFSNSTVIQKA